MSKIRHAVSILGFHFIPSKVSLPSCVEILPSIANYYLVLSSCVGYSQYCQVLSTCFVGLFSVLSTCFGGLFPVLPSCVGVLPSIVSTRSCRQNTEERSAETRQTQTMANTETKIKTNTKTMKRAKIKTETKTDTGRSTGTRRGRSLSAGQGLCEFVRNHVDGHEIVQDWYIIV